MENFSLTELLSYQVAHTQLKIYENEFLSITAIQNNEEYAVTRETSLAWLAALNKKEEVDIEAMVERSNRLRQKGNLVYKGKSGGDRNTEILNAGRLYTQAIFAAPECSEALALAHANRAMVLQEFGYYQQAYDDCVYALRTGRYPKRLFHKIITRQAYCSWYLKNAPRLREHLAELDKFELNEIFMRHVAELREGLCNFYPELEKLSIKNNSSLDKPVTDKTHIVASNDNIRGRFMTATTAIETGELIFKERISSFVPVGGNRVCHQCATTLLIPFPCTACRGQVIYCSLLCSEKHIKIHQYECIGYRCKLFDQIGIAHLALRVVLDELPNVTPLLQEQRNAAAIWFELTSSTGSIQNAAYLSYTPTLQMVSHLEKMSLADVIWFALMSDLLVLYVKEYTPFFDIFSTSGTSPNDWKIIIGALILRHIGQFIVNAHTCISLAPTGLEPNFAANYDPILLHEIWSQPFHLRCGFLHKFCDYKEITAANLPYLSICNHACAPSFRPKFCGRYFYAYADKTIQAGEEIFNCYTLNYKKSLKQTRSAYLKHTYHFDCKCAKCRSIEEDAAYENYHRYKCRNSKCQAIFIPTSAEGQLVNWWHVKEDNSTKRQIKCPTCEENQEADWLTKFSQLLQCINDGSKRSALLQLYKSLDTFLLDFHSLKLTMAVEIVAACFEISTVPSALTDDEYACLIQILKFCLRGTADQCGIHSIEFVATMTYLWDMIALKKYKCPSSEMQNMLSALEIVSEEYRTNL